MSLWACLMCCFLVSCYGRMTPEMQDQNFKLKRTSESDAFPKKFLNLRSKQDDYPEIDSQYLPSSYSNTESRKSSRNAKPKTGSTRSSDPRDKYTSKEMPLGKDMQKNGISFKIDINPKKNRLVFQLGPKEASEETQKSNSNKDFDSDNNEMINDSNERKWPNNNRKFSKKSNAAQDKRETPDNSPINITENGDFSHLKDFLKKKSKKPIREEKQGQTSRYEKSSPEMLRNLQSKNFDREKYAALENNLRKEYENNQMSDTSHNKPEYSSRSLLNNIQERDFHKYMANKNFKKDIQQLKTSAIDRYDVEKPNRDNSYSTASRGPSYDWQDREPGDKMFSGLKPNGPSKNKSPYSSPHEDEFEADDEVQDNRPSEKSYQGNRQGAPKKNSGHNAEKSDGGDEFADSSDDNEYDNAGKNLDDDRSEFADEGEKSKENAAPESDERDEDISERSSDDEDSEGYSKHSERSPDADRKLGREKKNENKNENVVKPEEVAKVRNAKNASETHTESANVDLPGKNETSKVGSEDSFRLSTPPSKEIRSHGGKTMRDVRQLTKPLDDEHVEQKYEMDVDKNDVDVFGGKTMRDVRKLAKPLDDEHVEQKYEIDVDKNDVDVFGDDKSLEKKEASMETSKPSSVRQRANNQPKKSKGRKMDKKVSQVSENSKMKKTVVKNVTRNGETDIVEKENKKVLDEVEIENGDQGDFETTTTKTTASETATIGDDDNPEFQNEERVEKQSKTILKSKDAVRNETSRILGQKTTQYKDNKEKYHEEYVQTKDEDKYPNSGHQIGIKGQNLEKQYFKPLPLESGSKRKFYKSHPELVISNVLDSELADEGAVDDPISAGKSLVYNDNRKDYDSRGNYDMDDDEYAGGGYVDEYDDLEKDEGSIDGANKGMKNGGRWKGKRPKGGRPTGSGGAENVNENPVAETSVVEPDEASTEDANNEAPFESNSIQSQKTETSDEKTVKKERITVLENPKARRGSPNSSSEVVGNVLFASPKPTPWKGPQYGDFLRIGQKKRSPAESPAHPSLKNFGETERNRAHIR